MGPSEACCWVWVARGLMGRLIRRNVCSLTARGRKTNTGHYCIAATVAANVLMSTAEGPHKKKTYELPDGNIIFVGDEHLRCPEVPFLTRFSGKMASEISDTSFLSIMARHFCGDPGCFVSVCCETHDGLREEAHRERIAQPIFEMFNVPAMSVATQAHRECMKQPMFEIFNVLAASVATQAHRERMKQPMFEMFNVLAAPVVIQADLSLIALRRTTGIGTDSCDDVSHSSHVFSDKGSCGQQEQRR